MEGEAEKLLKQVVDGYGDLKGPAGTLGQAAGGELFVLQHLAVGRTLPELDGEDLALDRVRLSDSRGKVVLVVSWATWCGPCVAELPSEQALLTRHAGKPFAILGVNADQDRDAARKVIDKAAVTWPSLWDGDKGPVATGGTSRVGRRFT